MGMLQAMMMKARAQAMGQRATQAPPMSTQTPPQRVPDMSHGNPISAPPMSGQLPPMARPAPPMSGNTPPLSRTMTASTQLPPQSMGRGMPMGPGKITPGMAQRAQLPPGQEMKMRATDTNGLPAPAKNPVGRPSGSYMAGAMMARSRFK